MSSILHTIGQVWVPALIVLMAVSIVLVVRFIATRYKKVPPNAVGIFYGRKYKDASGNIVGFKVLSGGGRVLLPLVENYQEMSTAAFQLTIDEREIPNADNVKMSVEGIATCKLSTASDDLNRAVAAFLGKRDSDIAMYVQNILKGHLRSIIGKLTIEELFRKRDEFNKNVVAESSTELKELGIQVVNLVVTNVKDELGYIDALGLRAVAQTKAEAQIKVAEAQRDQDIAVSNAQRAAALTQAENAATVAEAEKDRDIKKAAFKKEADTKRAEAEQAFAIANAAQEQTLRVNEAARDAAAAEAQIRVQQKEAERKEQELIATVVKPAEAAKQKMEIEAEATRKKTVIDAQAEAEKLRTTAEARKLAATAEGEGQANAQRAVLLAQAEGKAAEKLQALMAEAKGTKELAEALREMSDASRMIIILDKLPMLLDKGGDAAAKIASAIFGSVAAPLGQIDEIRIIDMGGNNGAGGLGKIASVVPNTVAQVFAAFKAQGIDITQIMGKLGIDPSKLAGLMGGATAGSPAEPPAQQ